MAPDQDAMFNEESTLLRLQDQTNPLSSLQAEVARMSGFIKEAFRNHEKQIDETKKVMETIATQGQETKAAVDTLRGRVQHIEDRLERTRGTWLLALSPVVALIGIAITTYIALNIHH